MQIFYKATQPDGTDFYTGKVLYEPGATVEVSARARKQSAECCSSSVLHASTVPTETLIGGLWPCRLFEVTGRPVAEEGYKRGFRRLTVVREIDAHLALGPQGKEVASLIERARKLTAEETFKLDAAWAAARHAAGYPDWYAARYAAGAAARYAAWAAARHAAGAAARHAVGALVVRDLVSQDCYDVLTESWATIVGKVHPDDEERMS